MRQIHAKLAFAAIISCVCVSCALGQGKTFKLGIEAQAYPTGFITGIRGDLYLSDFSKVHFRTGYNLVRHGDAGEHLDERGGGWGFTVGYDILPIANHRWTTGIRSDVWFNSIDWYDNTVAGRIEGNTRVTVLQPTAQAGYRIPFGEMVELVPTVAFGYEINVRTKGAKVGQGPILLLGFVLNYAL